VQIIITRLFKEEFDLDLYTTMGLVENSGPIHNLYIKNQLTETWSFKNAIFSWYIPEGPQGLSKINEINYYLGPNVAYFLAFITLNISWSWVFIIPFMVGSLVHIFEKQFELKSSLHLIIFGFTIWVFEICFHESFKRRVNELRFLWDLRQGDHETIDHKVEGKFKISICSEKIGTLHDSTGLSQTFSPQFLLLTIIKFCYYGAMVYSWQGSGDIGPTPEDGNK
jgi:hypothetical protein